MLTFADGVTSQSFTVAIKDDAIVDGTRTINLALSSPTGGVALGAQSAAVITITDDEGFAPTSPPLFSNSVQLGEINVSYASVTGDGITSAVPIDPNAVGQDNAQSIDPRRECMSGCQWKYDSFRRGAHNAGSDEEMSSRIEQWRIGRPARPMSDRIRHGAR